MGSSQDHSIDEQLERKAKHLRQRKAKQKPEQTEKLCGSFCKQIGPRDQRKIILECLRIDMNGLESSVIKLNTKPDSKHPNLRPQEVSIKCSANKLKRYIIDAKWWAKWCDYTNFDQNDIILNQFDKESDTLGMSGPINFNNYMSTKRFESTQLYVKPERIENECLLMQRNFESGVGGIDSHVGSMRGLRENLFEHYDFEALYPSIWLHLYSWYSADTQIARYLKQDALIDEVGLMDGIEDSLKNELKDDLDGGAGKNMELDLYPSKLNEAIFKNHSYYYDQKENERKGSGNGLQQEQAAVEASREKMEDREVAKASKLQQMLGLRGGGSFQANAQTGNLNDHRADQTKSATTDTGNYPGIGKQRSKPSSKGGA